MARSRSRLIMLLFTGFLALLFISGMNPAHAQQYGGEWIEDDNLHIDLRFDGISITTANSDANAIIVPRNEPMEIYLDVNVTNDVPLLMNGSIVFYYNDIPVLPIVIQSPYDNSTTVLVPNDPAFDPIPVTYMFNLSQYLQLGPIDIITGIFEARLSFFYSEVDPTDYARSKVLHEINEEFYFRLETDNVLQVITSVAGIATTASTVGAVAGFTGNIKALFEGVQTAHKVRSIQKKASEIRSLPNLTVLGALPLLFSIVATYVKVKKKKKKDETVSESEDAAVSEYIIRQRLREVAPEAWPGDKCPQCKRKWDKKNSTCKKCKINEDQARDAYTELLVSRTERAVKVMGKKKSLSIRKLAKKIKSNEYNAGVIGAAMVDTDVTEIEKVETPFRSFILNIGGLIFLVLTWQQLLGGASSQFQTTLTFVGAGMSLAVIVALYFARKIQIEKMRKRVEAGGMMMPTEAERIGEKDPKSIIKEKEVEPEEEVVSEEAVEIEDEADAFDDDEEEESDDETASNNENLLDDDLEDSDWDDDESDEDSLTPERLDKERK
ncbi:MAG: hypothetical protein ACFFED_08715 [Candidatus Thorarchaeota archaeon]